ncbi:Polyadenylate-binding protein, cytoplasmic and nuclear [Vanrija pseudolonga]|uniref:Polyadenylate-binding protein, cytoplasmic and nuclear n=1 Tax=Vanrija pseudolonga TaxID=143232 RepID=A0AAF0Y8D4_9TREE|nr:Polyadenylate-binding protein, cytoplasmic and nuclear [Vanrija pseudolonga]
MPSPLDDLHEVRLHGLNKSITTEALGEFLGKGVVRVRGIILHPQQATGFQWAQTWVETEVEVASLLGLRESLAANGIISRFKVPDRKASITPPQTSWDALSQLSKTPRSQPTPGLLGGLRTSFEEQYDPRDPHAPLPRNLYILNLPIELTQIEFKDLFLSFGSVEHSILLSQLDGMGRRRGFVLMSSHREAMDVIHQMHGKWIEGMKLDVSWALVQREAKNMPQSKLQHLATVLTLDTLPNRVIHPPTSPQRVRESVTDSTVIVENLDAKFFPDTETVAAIFQPFGPIARVMRLSDSPFSVAIQFEHAISAVALISANGLQLGDRILQTRPFSADTNSNFNPFSDLGYDVKGRPMAGRLSPLPPRHTRLNADSQPFIPTFKPAAAEVLKSSAFSSVLATIQKGSSSNLSSDLDRDSQSSSPHSARTGSHSATAGVKLEH